MTTVLAVIDIVAFIVLGASVAYVAFFAVAAVVGRGREATSQSDSSEGARFLVLFPAYAEDAVIVGSVRSFLAQDYPRSLYDVVVVSDHMTEATNDALRALGVTVLTPVFTHSTKAAALQHAITSIGDGYGYVVILDADNVVSSDFLSRLCGECSLGYRAVQCHRMAKNRDNDVAVLDAVSEEINNTLFRYGHNVVGLSSSLIGSGMCFDYCWFADRVTHLKTAGEDRELEALLLSDGVHIHYAGDIAVYDEKVSSSRAFSQQRRRWLSAQLHSLITMLPAVPRAIRGGNIDYIDKVIQQALIPRSMLIALTLAMLILNIIAVTFSLFTFHFSLLKWFVLAVVLFGSLVVAIPRPLRRWSLVRRVLTAATLTFRMFRSATRLSASNRTFTHTEHNKTVL